MTTDTSRTHPMPRQDGLDLTIGVRSADLAPARLELRPGTSVIVAGPAGSGKTTALRALAAAALNADPSCRIVVVSDDPDEWPGAAQTLPTDAGPTLVLVDGVASVTTTMVQDFDASTNHLLWVAIADRMERLQNGPFWLGQNLIGQTGLLLAPRQDDGDLFTISLPVLPASEFPPGRGFLVKDGVPELIQVAGCDTGLRARAQTSADRDRSEPTRTSNPSSPQHPGASRR